MADSEEKFTRHMLTAEYNKDGRLQIVKVEPFDRYQVEEGSSAGTHILSDLTSNSDVNEPQYIVDPSKEGAVQLDLMNFKLIRYEDGHESLRLLSNDNEEEGSQEILCLMQTSDNEDSEGLETYTVVENAVSESLMNVMMLDTNMQGTIEIENQNLKTTETSQPKPQITPEQLLAKAKAYQRAKAQLIKCHSQPGKRGRKRKTELPPQQDLLTSSNFKLYLYSCKMCNFKCNIVKELTAHKMTEHGGGSSGRASVSRSQQALQCARCPYKATLHTQLVKHVQEKHRHNMLVEAEMAIPSAPAVKSGAAALMCEQCGFESRDSAQLETHTLLAHRGGDS